MLKVLATIAVALAAVPAFASPPALASPPAQLPVPAAVAAAHPNGHQLTATVQPVSTTFSPLALERITCWRAFFTGDNSGWFGTEQELINPYWCGNGSAVRSADTSWHYQSCSILVSCLGETSVGTWYGCPNGCTSLGRQITGHFKVFISQLLSVDETVVFELYGDGSSWSYAYHN